MLKNELFKNYNGIISVIILILATIYYYFGRPDNMSEETRYLANLIFDFALVGYNLMMSLYFNLSKKMRNLRFLIFFFSQLTAC